MKLYLCLISSLFLSLGTADTSDSHLPIILPAPTNIEVQLSISSDSQVSVSITNVGEALIKDVAHPLEYVGATSFLVTDQYGNLVKPEGLAKINPRKGLINLPVKKTSYFKLNSLRFISGTGLFEYKLTKGKQYRIIAVYRPSGFNGPGFCSKEIVHVHK